MNALSQELIDQLDRHIQEIATNNEIRALLLTAHGKAFCTGADLKERVSMSTKEVEGFLQKMLDCFKNISNLPIPTIAAINGYALGGGLELALCFDLRIAVDDFEPSHYIGLPETSLGIIPGAGGTQRLSRLVGIAKAKELIFTAKRLSASEALCIGLVNEIGKSSDLLSAGIDLALAICANAPVALRAAKAAINKGQDMNLSEALEWEQECYKLTLPTKDRTEALLAFKEKRKPVFTGE